MAKLIQVIETERKVGTGREDDPYRTVKQFWSPEGELLMEDDDWQANELRGYIRDLFGLVVQGQATPVTYDEATRLLRLAGHRPIYMTDSQWAWAQADRGRGDDGQCLGVNPRTSPAQESQG